MWVVPRRGELWVLDPLWPVSHWMKRLHGLLYTVVRLCFQAGQLVEVGFSQERCRSLHPVAAHLASVLPIACRSSPNGSSHH
jgi:hypothetical protein